MTERRGVRTWLWLSVRNGLPIVETQQLAQLPIAKSVDNHGCRQILALNKMNSITTEYAYSGAFNHVGEI